ncbi:putative quinol monooxygenase [Alicyclobacillus fastidiosus]|uniref:Quinol monooxygenase n=1 Tax=Alicyclobacillus fastidiosus TaxID=392011 RepID=A0ABV5AH02_9BACL|nr:putative quinol monooxygenase [Alicyclobacillus fastidiosus]WEH09682.1 putative quinol monooxygenase [Alicyclobacillus fastidiosus]
MLIVHARLTGKADKRNELLALVESLAKSSRREEGCQSYRFYEDTEVPNDFLFVEQWESQDALDRHAQQPHFASFQEKVAHLVTAPPDIRAYQVGE